MCDRNQGNQIQELLHKSAYFLSLLKYKHKVSKNLLYCLPSLGIMGEKRRNNCPITRNMSSISKSHEKIVARKETIKIAAQLCFISDATSYCLHSYHITFRWKLWPAPITLKFYFNGFESSKTHCTQRPQTNKQLYYSFVCYIGDLAVRKMKTAPTNRSSKMYTCGEGPDMSPRHRNVFFQQALIVLSNTGILGSQIRRPKNVPRHWSHQSFSIAGVSPTRKYWSAGRTTVIIEV